MKIKTHSRILCAILMLTLCATMVAPAFAAEEQPTDILSNLDELTASLYLEQGIYSNDSYDGFSLNWSSSEIGDILDSVSKDDLTYSYTYDECFNRARKNGPGVSAVYAYDADGHLVSEERNGIQIDYLYTDEELIGFSVDNGTYFFEKDVDNNVIAIYDESGLPIVRYDYDAGLVTTIWEKTSLVNGLMILKARNQLVPSI